MHKERVLGVDVTLGTYGEIVDYAFRRIHEGKKTMIVAINPEKIMKAKEDAALRALLNRAEVQIPDGVGVLLASKLQKGRIRDRVTGVDMMLHVCERAAKTGERVFLYGAKPGTAEAAKAALEQRYPGIRIAGVQHGYEPETDRVLAAINAAAPHILFVAMGSPRQERWIEAHRDRLAPMLYQGVGGSFDVLAGNVQRAPEFYQKNGLEWLYRLAKEPSRVKRQIALPKFLLQVLKGRGRAGN